MPVNTHEQKNNVGTQKMHMTHSRLKPGFEGINKHSNWLRPAGQEKKKSSDLSFESVEILHEQKSLEQLLQATEARTVDAVSKELLPASQPKPLQALISPRVAMFTLLQDASKNSVQQHFVLEIREVEVRKVVLGDRRFLSGFSSILDFNYY